MPKIKRTNDLTPTGPVELVLTFTAGEAMDLRRAQYERERLIHEGLEDHLRNSDREAPAFWPEVAYLLRMLDATRAANPLSVPPQSYRRREQKGG